MVKIFCESLVLGILRKVFTLPGKKNSSYKIEMHCTEGAIQAFFTDSDKTVKSAKNSTAKYTRYTVCQP